MKSVKNTSSKVKWFSGGNDRRQQAIEIITKLIDCPEVNQSDALLSKLDGYREELTQQKQSVPFILSRMNVDVGKSIQDTGVTLSDTANALVDDLGQLSQIHWGY